MTHDLVIRGGTIVDGTGARASPATSRSTAIGSSRSARSPAAARRTIDADGAFVTPGFVDIHTHLDAQLAWDPDATSSCWHGVTSVVLGNCGVTFAPVRPGQRVVARGADGVGGGHPGGEHPRRARLGLGDLRRVPGGDRPHAQGRQRRRDDRALRPAALHDGRTRPRRSAGHRRRHRADDGARRRSDGRGRARLLDVAHAAAPRPRRPARSRHLGRRTRAARDRRRARQHRKGVYEVAPRFERPGRDYEGTRTGDALDGRDQPAHRTAR